MAKPLLIIGNKNYSSWSLRPYMMLEMAKIPFDEKLIHFGTENFTAKVKKFSPAGLVPVLKHNGVAVWDTLSIVEYIAETWPAKHIWPKNKAARAMARSLSAEMHSGFRALRTQYPMNLRRPTKALAMSGSTQQEVERLEKAWSLARKLYGGGGPFLFGKFSAADAMFTPVLTRLETYGVPVKRDTQHYMNAVLATPAYQNWKLAALKEKWVVAEDEVD